MKAYIALVAISAFAFSGTASAHSAAPAIETVSYSGAPAPIVNSPSPIDQALTFIQSIPRPPLIAPVVEPPVPVVVKPQEVPAKPKSTPTPVQVAPRAVTDDSVWDRLAQCESGGNWASSTGQFEGGIQFLNSTWLSYGGGEFAQHAYDASREQQIEIGKRQLAGRPDWSAWPACSQKLGLR